MNFKKSNSHSWEPHGLALKAYWGGDKEVKIGIKMFTGEFVEMPADIYFRTKEDCPELELIALNRSYGRILDIGAGAGSHSLMLQEKGYEVYAIDIDHHGVEIMKERGLNKVNQSSFLSFNSDLKFDTLLFLMNGVGIAGNLEGLDHYLQKCHELLSNNGQVLLDSSDLRISNPGLKGPHDYYGSIDYQLSFEDFDGTPYSWLYLDQETLIRSAKKNKWHCQVLYEAKDGSYLAQLKKN